MWGWKTDVCDPSGRLQTDVLRDQWRLSGSENWTVTSAALRITLQIIICS
jgi:hypothetical protein